MSLPWGYVFCCQPALSVLFFIQMETCGILLLCLLFIYLFLVNEKS
jgi:hypothetical protein